MQPRRVNVEASVSTCEFGAEPLSVHSFIVVLHSHLLRLLFWYLMCFPSPFNEYVVLQRLPIAVQCLLFLIITNKTKTILLNPIADPCSKHHLINPLFIKDKGAIST